MDHVAATAEAVSGLLDETVCPECGRDYWFALLGMATYGLTRWVRTEGRRVSE
jgi:hypothetical protein